MEFTVGTTIYGISDKYTNKNIREGKIHKIIEHFMISTEYQIIMSSANGVEYTTKAYINHDKTMLSSNFSKFFTSKNNAIKYHNKLVNDYIKKVQDKYMI